MGIAILKLPSLIQEEILRYLDINERLILSLTSTKANFITKLPKLGGDYPIEYLLYAKYTDNQSEIEILLENCRGRQRVQFAVKFSKASRRARRDTVCINNHSIKASLVGNSKLICDSRQEPLALWIVLKHFINMGIKTIRAVIISSANPDVLKFAKEVLMMPQLEYHHVELKLRNQEGTDAEEMYYYFLQNCVDLECNINFNRNVPIVDKDTSKLEMFTFHNHDWLTVDDILTLKDCIRIHIEKAPFSRRDIIKIIKAWQEKSIFMEQFKCHVNDPFVKGKRLKHFLNELKARVYPYPEIMSIETRYTQFEDRYLVKQGDLIGHLKLYGRHFEFDTEFF